ncbi:hypothetical protein ACHAPC_005818 [Botrytis cinerea]|uniref:Uncharacterized protein n=1 Tax=Botryotinia fuckeliana (strain T4) TaxID=999810 RepID=G2YUK6_BOTF4|nr:hypothetical protein BofuT4_P157000.1 [Botrytis cinerea T4]
MPPLRTHLQRFAQRFKNDPVRYFVAMTPVASGLLLGMSLSTWRLKKYLGEQVDQGYIEVRVEPKELEQAFEDMGLLLKKHGIETEWIESQTRKNSPSCTIRWNIGGVLKAFAGMKEREKEEKSEREKGQAKDGIVTIDEENKKRGLDPHST